MTIKNDIFSRKSIRDFTSQDLSDEVISELVAKASQAASWQNTQAWQIYVAKGQALEQIRTGFATAQQAGQVGQPDLTTPDLTKRSDLSKANIQQWKEDVEKVIGTGTKAWETFGKAGAAFFNAPAVAFITASNQASEYTIYDMGAFGQTLMYAAAEKGIGSMTAYNLVKYPAIIKRTLNIPTDQEVVIGIGLGYASENKINQIQTHRLPVDKVLHIQK